MLAASEKDSAIVQEGDGLIVDDGGQVGVEGVEGFGVGIETFEAVGSAGDEQD